MHLLELKVGARNSPLSKAQVDEVFQELSCHHPGYYFTPHWIVTYGDLDRKTSLRTLGKTDFFTKEVDDQLLSGQCRIAIHSAKDLPEPLKNGLTVVALTKGVDPADVLLVRDEQLPDQPLIGTSSLRREHEALTLFPKAQIVDIRGTIHERLRLLETKQVDALILAKAALIRLNLPPAYIRQIALHGPTTPLQGQLAVVARTDDTEMATLFSSIDCRPRMLYTGIESPKTYTKRITHVPLIETFPRTLSFEGLKEATHVIITSKTAANYFMAHIQPQEIASKQFISVGKMTTERLASFGISAIYTAENESQEGIIEVLSQIKKSCTHIFWPHSNLSRDTLQHYLDENGFSYTSCILYETCYKAPSEQIDFNSIDEIFFSSRSTVDAFFSFFGPPPHNKKLLTQGETTKRYLHNKQKDFL